MRTFIFLAFLYFSLGSANASSLDGTYAADSSRSLKITSTSETSFAFTLSIGVTAGEAECMEGDVSCLMISGEATKANNEYGYVDASDPSSQLTFVFQGGNVGISSTQGSFGSGSGNAQQLPLISGFYIPVQPTEAASAAGKNMFFRTPSGNIGCVIWTGENSSLRCDMRELKQTYTQKPEDCPVDWGSAFEISADGNMGEVICHGDTAFTEEAQILDYGKSFEYASFNCKSEKTGLTCTNASGHGFVLSKAKQKIF